MALMAPSTAAPPAMSIFILLHPGRRLDGGAAGIEGHAFAHQDERRLLGRALRLVLNDDECRRLARSTRYA